MKTVENVENKLNTVTYSITLQFTKRFWKKFELKDTIKNVENYAGKRITIDSPPEDYSLFKY